MAVAVADGVNVLVGDGVNVMEFYCKVAVDDGDDVLLMMKLCCEVADGVNVLVDDKHVV